MNLLELSKDEIEQRIARYAQLTVLDAQEGHDMPQVVADLIWSRKLLPVLAREEAQPSPFGNTAPILGAGDLSITYAVCPAGTGPSLHAHRQTWETFTVLRGRFEFSVGATGAEKVVLEPFDTFSVPPAVCRAFRNIGDEEGVLQVIITGGTHDRNDIVFPKNTANEIAAHAPSYLAYFKELGLHFEN
jgi:mannose-6-phosphate isomerase-like protein (cupin superfamily)